MMSEKKYINNNLSDFFNSKTRKEKLFFKFDILRMIMGSLLSIILFWSIAGKLSSNSIYIPELFVNPYWKFGICTFCIIIYTPLLPKKMFEEIKNKQISNNSFKFLSIFIGYIFSISYMFIEMEGTKFIGNKNYLFFEAIAEISIIMFASEYIGKHGRSNSSMNRNIFKFLTNYISTLMIDDKEQEVLGQDIRKNHILKVRENEIIPVDGIIISGNVVIDNSLIKGDLKKEIYRNEGNQVYSGMLIKKGEIFLKATQTIYESKISEYIKEKEKKKEIKMQMEKEINGISKILMPSLLTICFIVFILWGSISNDWDKSTSILITCLLVSYPMSFTMIIPFSLRNLYLAGIKRKILFTSKKPFSKKKMLSMVYIFDKRGTITSGKFSVEYSTIDKKYFGILKIIEEKSNHSTGKAILNFLNKYDILEEEKYMEVSELNGLGASITKNNGEKYYIGSEICFKKFHKKEIKLDKKIKLEKERGKKIVFFFTKIKKLGYFVLEDAIEGSSLKIIDYLKYKNSSPILISGDTEKSTKFISNKIGTNIYYANKGNEEKGKLVNNIKKYGVDVCFIGNRETNVSALKNSSIGISTANGSNISKLKSDVLILNNDLTKIIEIQKLINKTSQTIKWGTYISMGISIAALIISISGIVSLPMATIVILLIDFFPIIFSERIKYLHK